MTTSLYGVIFLLEALIAFQYFEWTFDGARYSSWKRLFIILGGYAGLYGCFQLHILVLNMVAFPIVNFIIIKYIYRQYYLTSFFQSIAMAVIMNLAEMMVTAVFSGISEKLWEPSKGLWTVFLLGMLSKFLYFMVLLIISLFASKKKSKVQAGRRGWLMLVIPVCILAVVLLLNYMCFFCEISNKEEKIIWICCMFCLVIIIISYIIFGYLQRVHQDNLNKSLQLQHEEYESAYYKALLRQDETQKMMIHDIKKHINTVYDLMKDKDYEEAEKYMEQLYTSKKLLETISFSDNHTVNVILNRYATQFIEDDILYSFDVRKKCLDFICVDDINVLLCNMLDNAYEGMAGIPEACVDLRIITQADGIMTTIAMANDCKSDSVSLVSKKSDSKFHGYGIKSMRNVAKKYDGDAELFFSNEDHRFHTIVYLYNSK